MRAEYDGGDSAPLIGARYGCSHKTVLAAVRRGGQRVRSNSEAQRKYECDHGFFEAIDSEAKAYWLGFIAADGYVGPRYVSVALASRDREHLVRLQAALQSTHPVRDGLNDGYPRSAFYVQSHRLAADLAGHGVCAAKSLTLEWPVHLQANLLPHYLRGYFDGDGSWYLCKPHNPAHHPQLGFGLIGSWAFCRGAQRYLVSAAGVPANTIKSASGGNMAQLEYAGNLQASRVYRLLYAGATVWLPRKRDKASPHVRFQRRRSTRPTLRSLSPAQTAAVRELRATTKLSQREIAERFGVSQATVSRALSD